MPGVVRGGAARHTKGRVPQVVPREPVCCGRLVCVGQVLSAVRPRCWLVLCMMLSDCLGAVVSFLGAASCLAVFSAVVSTAVFESALMCLLVRDQHGAVLSECFLVSCGLQ